MTGYDGDDGDDVNMRDLYRLLVVASMHSYGSLVVWVELSRVSFLQTPLARTCSFFETIFNWSNCLRRALMPACESFMVLSRFSS